MIIYRLIMELYRWAKFNFYKARAIANWKATGKRNWVIGFGRHGMTVVDTDTLKHYNRKAKKQGRPVMDLPYLMDHAMYGTPIGTYKERRRK
jgi:hypothetical protein